MGPTLQKIQSVISAMNQNLPALLQSAHISNAVECADIGGSEPDSFNRKQFRRFDTAKQACDRARVDGETAERGTVEAAMEPASVRSQRK